MLIHPWDAAVDDAEWRAWLDEGRDFGQLAVNGPAGLPPLVVPTHFVREGSTLLVHLARPNPIWEAVEADRSVLLTVLDDYAFIPGPWRVSEDVPPAEGVPTSYYSVVQFSCRARIVDDPEQKADLLRKQLEHFQPGDHAEVGVDLPPFGSMLPGIRGLVLDVESVAAKFKYDDHKPETLRRYVSGRLEARGQGRDAAAAARQRRRTGATGRWKAGGSDQRS